jgi:hypothetical protein
MPEEAFQLPPVFHFISFFRYSICTLTESGDVPPALIRRYTQFLRSTAA